MMQTMEPTPPVTHIMTTTTTTHIMTIMTPTHITTTMTTMTTMIITTTTGIMTGIMTLLLLPPPFLQFLLLSQLLFASQSADASIAALEHPKTMHRLLL